MINLIQSIFDKNTATKTESNVSLQSNAMPKEELKMAPTTANNHGIEVQELSFEDVARIMAGK